MRANLYLLLLSVAAAPAVAFTFPAVSTPLRRSAPVSCSRFAPSLRKDHGVFSALPHSAGTQLPVRSALRSRRVLGALLRMNAG